LESATGIVSYVPSMTAQSAARLRPPVQLRTASRGDRECKVYGRSVCVCVCVCVLIVQLRVAERAQGQLLATSTHSEFLFSRVSARQRVRSRPLFLISTSPLVSFATCRARIFPRRITNSGHYVPRSII